MWEQNKNSLESKRVELEKTNSNVAKKNRMKERMTAGERKNVATATVQNCIIWIGFYVVFPYSAWNTIVLCTHLAIGFHSNAISEEFKCKTKKKQLKSRRKRSEMKRKKMHIKICFWFNLCKEHKYGNKTPASTKSTSFAAALARLAILVLPCFTIWIANPMN